MSDKKRMVGDINMSQKKSTQCLVLGSGPGGYAAAFRAADLGMQVTLVEKFETLGGVCLNVGCIPSKALLHVAEVVNETDQHEKMGIKTSKPELEIPKVQKFKEQTVSKLTKGLDMLAKKRKVEVVHGQGHFEDNHTLAVIAQNGEKTEIQFESCIIATGSKPVHLPFLPDDSRVVNSTGALKLSITTGKMLVIGGGIIGCEMATVYNAMGMEVHVVEMTGQIMPGADIDLVKPCQKMLEKRGVTFHVNTKVESAKASNKGISVQFTGNDKLEGEQLFDLVLESVGRKPNTAGLNLDQAGVEVDASGYITVDARYLRTSQPHIYAVGDIIGDPMLAHKATAQGRIAAELVAGEKVAYDTVVIPNVAYTDPEVAWVGKTQQHCKEEGLEVEMGVFPWAANGRSLCIGRDEGCTKIITDANTGRIIGAGIVGRHAGDLIAELGLAIEMGCDIEDVALTVHAHPTLAETVGMAAEACEGTITDLYMPKPKPKFKKNHEAISS